MEKSINSLHIFFFKSQEVFKFWATSYTIFFFGILTGLIVAAFSGDIGLAILLISAIMFLFLCFKNIKKEYELLKILKEYPSSKDNFFQKSMKKIVWLITVIFFLDLFLVTWLVTFFLKFWYFFIYKNMKFQIKIYKQEMLEDEKNKKINQTYEKMVKKMVKYKLISDEKEEVSPKPKNKQK